MPVGTGAGHGLEACAGVQAPEVSLMLCSPGLETLNNKGPDNFILHWAGPEWWYGAWAREGRVTFLLR